MAAETFKQIGWAAGKPLYQGRENEGIIYAGNGNSSIPLNMKKNPIYGDLELYDTPYDTGIEQNLRIVDPRFQKIMSGDTGSPRPGASVSNPQAEAHFQSAGLNFSPPAPTQAPNTPSAPTSGMPTSTPPAASTPSFPAYQAPQYTPIDLEKYFNEYKQLLTPSAAETQAQQNINNLNASFRQGVQNIEGQPIAMPFVTGQTAAIQKTADMQRQTLTEQLALAQAARMAAADVAKAQYGFADSEAERRSQGARDSFNQWVQQRQLDLQAQGMNSDQAYRQAQLEMQRQELNMGDQISPYQKAQIDLEKQQLAEQQRQFNEQQKNKAPDLIGDEKSGYYTYKDGALSPVKKKLPNTVWELGSGRQVQDTSEIDPNLTYIDGKTGQQVKGSKLLGQTGSSNVVSAGGRQYEVIDL